MTGPDPVIHDCFSPSVAKDVDTRVKPAHDGQARSLLSVFEKTASEAEPDKNG